jgi:hypothetical protein
MYKGMYVQKIKVKIKVTLVQAMKDLRGNRGRYSFTLSLTSGLDVDMC